MQPMDPQDGADLLNAFFDKAEEDDLTPDMFVSPEALAVWDRLTSEEQIRAIWFHPRSMPEVPGKTYCFNSLGFYFNS